MESDSLKTKEFRSRLQTCRQRLAESDGTHDFGKYSEECLTLCEKFYGQSREYLLERELEFAELIQSLRAAIGGLAGDSNAFTVQVTQTTDRLERLFDVQDIRVLKKQISEEVHQLKRTVQEKKEREGAAYSLLSKRVELLQNSLNQSRSEASLDGLTGIPNRRTFDRTLERWLAQCTATGNPFVLALLDLDNFKAINDARGHQVGDRVLLCAAHVFSKSVRGIDFAARFGGEEFAVLLDGARIEQALVKFEEVLVRLAATTYDYDDGGRRSTLSFTASCGLAECTPGESPESLLKRADDALYEAKRTGKNRVVASPAAKKPNGLWKVLKPLVPFGTQKPV